LFLAATRDLYEVLIDGEWDAHARAHRSYYVYGNPMYSEVLRRWKRDHVRFVQNAGAPDRSGIRGENRAATQHRPVGYFRARGQIWQPRVAGEAKAVPRPDRRGDSVHDRRSAAARAHYSAVAERDGRSSA